VNRPFARASAGAYNRLMAKTLSNMRPLGTPLPEFALPDVTTGRTTGPADFEGKPVLLVMFLSRHCPFVKHIQSKLAEVCNEYVDKGAGVVAICSNDVENYPEDGPEGLRQMAAELDFRFPYLFDESQEVAMSFDAACTPDLFLFDGERALSYRGQFDDSRPANGVPVTGKDLREALDAVLAGRPAPSEQRPSVGCNIKWKAEATGPGARG
jgi:peroxiredoxin